MKLEEFREWFREVLAEMPSAELDERIAASVVEEDEPSFCFDSYSTFHGGLVQWTIGGSHNPKFFKFLEDGERTFEQGPFEQRSFADMILAPDAHNSGLAFAADSNELALAA